MQATATETERKTTERTLSDTAVTSSEQLQLVTFELGEEEFAGYRKDSAGEDGQVVVRTQLQLLF